MADSNSNINGYGTGFDLRNVNSGSTGHSSDRPIGNPHGLRAMQANFPTGEPQLLQNIKGLVKGGIAGKDFSLGGLNGRVGLSRSGGNTFIGGKFTF